MKKIIITLLLILFSTISLEAADGVINIESNFNVEETANRMERILKEKGMTIFNRINHSQGANKIGIKLRDTELIIFGNPKVGSILIESQQSIAIDLPQKALIWEDNSGKVWISYNDPSYIAKRHNLLGAQQIISKIENMLDNVAKVAAN